MRVMLILLELSCNCPRLTCYGSLNCSPSLLHYINYAVSVVSYNVYTIYRTGYEVDA